MTLWAKRSLLLAILLLLPITAQAQSAPAQPAASDQQLLKPEELDALVAPISEAVVVAVVVVAADGDRISRLSMMSFSSAISLTASAFIASAITAASAPMLA